MKPEKVWACDTCQADICPHDCLPATNFDTSAKTVEEVKQAPMKMNDEDKNVYHFQVQHGEVFVHNGKVIASWHENDACWRNEYMDGLLKSLGFTVITDEPLLHHNLVLEHAKEFGLIDDEDEDE